MTPPQPGPAATSLQTARSRAARVLRIEAAWPALLPALAAVCGFAVLALLALPQRLPFWLHLPLVLLLAGFVASRVWHVLRRLELPSGTAVDRRIEQSSGLRHRPLQMLLDTPALAKPRGAKPGEAKPGEAKPGEAKPGEANPGLDQPGTPAPVQDAIWQVHRERTLAGLDRLRAGSPRLGWRGHAYGRLTLALLPALLLAWIVAGAAAPGRLAAGFLPGLFAPEAPAPWIEAWITPPDYARAAPVFLTDPHGETTIPFGSVLQVNLTGVHGAPRLDVHTLDPARSGSDASPEGPSFRQLSKGSWSLSRTLDSSLRLSLRGNGRSLAAWTLRVTPLPETLVAWDGAPGAAGEHSAEPWRTRLPWRVGNPYGVSTLGAEFRLADPRLAAGATGLPPLQLQLPMQPGTREARGVSQPDLSADPRAGEPVIARLAATDATGKVTQGPEARFTLPSRPFRNPLASAVLETRKRVALGRESRDEGASDLQALGEAPGPFASDAGMFLNLSSIAALLRSDDVEDRAAIDEATGRLWELALSLEDGLHNDHQGARAAADVRAAREAVAAQLDRMRQLGEKGQSGKEQSELERRIQALSQAIARRMQALAEQARREHTELPPMPDMKMLSGGDLARMMQQMRDDAAHGNPRDAMQRLAQMQSMLDRMRAATPQDLQSMQQQAAAQEQVREQMAGLKDLVERQSGLLDRTQSRRRASDEENSGEAPGNGVDPQTSELLRRLGIPQSGDPRPGDEAVPPSGDEMPPQEMGRQQTGPQGVAPQEMPPDETPPGARRADGSPADGSNDPAENFAPDPAGSPAAIAAAQARRHAAEQSRKAQQRQDGHVQRSLGRALDELGQEFKALSGTQPGGFDEARKAMDKAREALASGQDAAAQDAQQQALADLQKGSKQMQQALSSGRGGASVLMPGMAGDSGGSRPGDSPGEDEADESDPSGARDPLGRPVASGPHADDGDTHVPDKAEQMRARDIEQELRRRDTDRTRAPDELNYLDRLLKPF